MSKRTFKLFSLLIALIAVPQLLKAQGPIFSQPYASPLRTNPAMMGANEDIHIGLGYRGKWMGLDDGYTTPRFTAMSPILVQESSKLDVGLSVMQDKAGAFSKMNAMLAVGYDLLLSEKDHHLSLALSGGFTQDKIDRSGLTYDEQYVDGSFSEDNPTGEQNMSEQTSYADLGFGLLWYYNPEKPEDDPGLNAFAGVSGYHMNSPNASLIGGDGTVPPLYHSIIGVKYMTKGKLDFTPNLRISNQEGTQQIASGIYTGYRLDNTKKIQLGFWYKEDNSFAAALGTKISGFSFGYSYDIASSPIRSRISGLSTHEISLSYAIDRGEDQFGPSPFPIF